jgi:sec-independent protein translocase protein TatB
MFNVGAGEIVVILMLALIVLGPDKLPSAARQAGKYLSEFRRMSDGFQRELRDAIDFDGTKPQSGTMAPVTTVDVAEAETGPAGDRVAEPVGESHRVIESANGPTLPPVMRPTVIPETAPPPADGPAVELEAVAEATTPTGSAVPSTPLAAPSTPLAAPSTPLPAASTLDIDGPTASFG